MSSGAMVSDVLKAQARSLKMPGIARNFEMLGRQAREEKWTYEDYLHEVLATEQSSRIDSAIRSRLRDARFPEPKTLDGFDFGAAEGLDATRLVELARCEWVRKANNLLLVGPIGTGKTHLAIALGTEAAKQRMHVAFWRAADMVRALVEARDTRELGRLERRLKRVDLLILDELGFVPFDRAGGEMLFNAIANRYEHKSVLVTSNLSFSEWPKVFAGDEKLTAALLDRLADHAAIITTHGKSYRMRRREVETSKKGGALAQGQVEIVAPTGSQGPPRKEDSSPETNPPPADPSARRQQHLRKR